MSSHQIVIQAEIRETLTKAETRLIRNADKVPAVLYQKGGNLNLSIPFKNLPKTGHTAAQLIGLDVGNGTRSVLMREVQIDPLTSKPIHIDFQEVGANDVTTARVPVEFVGLTKEQDKECQFKPLIRSLVLRGPVSSFPAKIQVSIAAMAPDSTLQLTQEVVPAGLKIRGSQKLALAQLSRK